MRHLAVLLTGTVVLAFGTTARAQQPPKPGPEHKLLKDRVGTWNTTM